MADAIVGATVQVLLEKALSLATNRIGLVFGFGEDLKRLRDSAHMIQVILADAEDKRTESRAVQLWLERLEGVSFDAYNVLDELNYEILRREVKSRNQRNRKVSNFYYSSKDRFCFRRRMASKVKNINLKLEMINQEAIRFGLSLHKSTTPIPAIRGVTVDRETDSTVAQHVKVVGRDNDESEVVDVLLSTSEKVVSVIPITGMGGLGKTTLAKLVYNNPRIQDHFSKRIWVCVSEQEFEGTRLFKLILEQLLGSNAQLVGRDAIVQRIQKELEGSRYLLVLDDVWNDNQELWDKFFDSLVGLSPLNERSWCLVTTRKLKAASFMATGAHYHYSLGKLSDEDCWSILKEKATAGEEMPEELSGIRQQIIKRCDGLPLAVNVIGGLLRLQKKEDWLSIVENKILKFSGDREDSVMQILKLSFDYLPSPSIKKCFAYCSIFVKDTRLESDQLIEIWMAEGFLQANLESETMLEEIGGNYLKILLQSSLLEEIKEGEVKPYYKMHDLVHDLAKAISKPERFDLGNGGIERNNQVEYLAFDSFEEITQGILEEASGFVRTLYLKSSISDDMLLKFKYLHVLKLSGRKISDELPNSIGKLKHLRYFDLSYYHMKTLPESLCNLFNLQTLKITGCKTLQDLPKGMRNLISLRHLHYFNDDAKFQMPVEMGRLTCLQTLQFFNVGEGKGHQIEELGCFKDLRGKMVIRNLELVKGKEAAKRANLSGKPNLMNLELYWGNKNLKVVQNWDDHVLEGLEPHPNLQELKIKNFMGDQLPRWLGNLSTLIKLAFVGCKRCKEVPVLGHLPCLEYLQFWELENVICIGTSFYGLDDRRGGPRSGSTSCSGDGQVLVSLSRRKIFPSLKTLILINMTNLNEWKEAEAVDDEAVFPMLENLTIEECCQLSTAPTHFPSLKRLTICNNVHVLAVKSILSTVTTTLESLSLDGMEGLSCLSDVVGVQHHIRHPNLRGLWLWRCPNLKRLWGCGTSLESLGLIECHNLMELPQDLCQFQSLRELEIRGCPRILRVGASPLPTCSNITEQEKRKGSLKNQLKSLEYFGIVGCKGLTEIASETLECGATLRRLQVVDCPSLVSFPLDLRQTPSLSTVCLHKCPKLFANNNTPRGFDHLSSLQALTIGPFSDDSAIAIEFFDWSGLISCSSKLRELTLYGSPQMESLLPDQLQYLTSLTVLHLREFGLIEALPDWLGNIASLEELFLCKCEKLQRLPSMPAMKKLTKLRSLYAERCPLLKERCSPESGPDSEWPKISHLPTPHIV